MHLLIIFLIYILSSCAGSELNWKARYFSVGLLEAIGSDHAVVGSFGIWSTLTSVDLWSTKQVTTDKYTQIQEYVKLRNAVLDFEPNGTKMEFENFIFINKDFKVLPEFRETMTTYFKARIYIPDFGYGANFVNVANYANAIIGSESPSFSNMFNLNHFTNFSMNMANVLSFVGTWTSPFNGRTTQTPTSDGKHEEHIMHQKIKLPYSHIEEIKANAMELSFGNTGKYCMLIIKPDPEVNIRETYQKTRIYTLTYIMEKLEKDVNTVGLKEINLTLPKFTTQSMLNLNKPLQDLGIDYMFQSDAGHFPGISNEDVYISSVEHTANIYFHEYGVAAFASTPGNNMEPSDTYESKSSDPFIYFILEKPTMTVIFNGLHSRVFDH